MSTLWFTSDTHHFHEAMLKPSHGARPFANVEDMNEALLTKFNERVSPDDIVYMLGDFVFGHDKQKKAHALLSRMSGKEIHWILGNHDNRNAAESLKNAGVVSTVSDIKEVRYKSKLIVLCHYAMRTWREQGSGSIHCYAHSHGSLPDDPHSLSIDVGVDTDLFGHEKFYPYSFEEIQGIMAKHKTPKPVDHHVN